MINSDNKTYTVYLEQYGDDVIVPLPDEVLAAANLHIGDVIEWHDNKDGSYLLKKRQPWYKKIWK